VCISFGVVVLVWGLELSRRLSSFFQALQETLGAAYFLGAGSFFFASVVVALCAIACFFPPLLPGAGTAHRPVFSVLGYLEGGVVRPFPAPP